MMKSSKSIPVLLSLGLCFLLAGQLAWAGHGGGGGHGGGFSGGRGGGFSGGRGAMAHGYRGGGGWFRGGWGRGYYGGFYGGLYFDPWFYAYPFGYDASYPDDVVAPGYGQIYVQATQLPQSTAPTPVGAPQSGQSSDWYYCRNPAGYYPYVRTCANDWQRVPSTPPE